MLFVRSGTASMDRALRPDWPELSDLLIDAEPQTLERRPVVREAVRTVPSTSTPTAGSAWIATPSVCRRITLLAMTTSLW